MAASFTKFDPRAFLDPERHAADGGRSAKLATLAALAGPTPNSENWPESDADLTTGLPVENLRPGVRAAKPAKPAKDGRQFATGDRTDWRPEDWRARFNERAGFLEHDGGWPRVEAEVQALEQCIVEWLNANPSFSPRRTLRMVRQARNAERQGLAIRSRRTSRMASRRMLPGLASIETDGSRPGIEGNGHHHSYSRF